MWLEFTDDHDKPCTINAGDIVALTCWSGGRATMTWIHLAGGMNLLVKETYENVKSLLPQPVECKGEGAVLGMGVHHFPGLT